MLVYFPIKKARPLLCASQAINNVEYHAKQHKTTTKIELKCLSVKQAFSLFHKILGPHIIWQNMFFISSNQILEVSLFFFVKYWSRKNSELLFLSKHERELLRDDSTYLAWHSFNINNGQFKVRRTYINAKSLSQKWAVGYRGLVFQLFKLEFSTLMLTQVNTSLDINFSDFTQLPVDFIYHICSTSLDQHTWKLI